MQYYLQGIKKIQFLVKHLNLKSFKGKSFLTVFSILFLPKLLLVFFVMSLLPYIITFIIGMGAGAYFFYKYQENIKSFDYKHINLTTKKFHYRNNF